MNTWEQKPVVMKEILELNKAHIGGFHVTNAEIRDYAAHNEIMDIIADLPDREANDFVIGLRNSLNGLIEKYNLTIDLEQYD